MNRRRNIQKYDKNADEYAEKLKDKGPVELIQSIREFIPTGGSMLEVGCAAGRDCRRLKDLGFNVTGIDLSTNLLAIAKRENTDIQFLKEDALRMSFEENSFDGIFTIGFMHELDRNDFLKFISECKRVLKVGGYIIVRTKEGNGEVIAPPDSLFDDNRIITLISEPELNTLFLNNGFSKIKSYVEYSPTRKTMRWLVGIYKKS